MARYAIYNITSGDILGEYVGSNPELNVSTNQDFLLVDDNADISNHYLENGVITAKPARPNGQFWIFDMATKSWILNPIFMPNTKAIQKSKISAKANQLRYSTIAYDGKNLDADEIAQTNISGKIAQLQNELALALPSNDLFWKDADNIVHTWTDPAVYLEWLQGLQVQIASRATSLYNTAWTGKAAIDAFTDINDVMNYDINALFGIV